MTWEQRTATSNLTIIATISSWLVMARHAEEGEEGEGITQDSSRLAGPWATFLRPSADQLTSLTVF